MRWNGMPQHEAALAVALLDGALRLTATCWPSITWRPPSRRLGALGHVIIAVDVPILLAISPHTLREAATSKLASNPPSRRLGGLGHVIAAADVPILLAISLHTLREAATSKPACTPLQQAPTQSRVALQWAHYLGRDVVARQVVTTTAATGQGTTAVITGIDAAATAAAVIAAARMIAPTPRSLPHLSLNAKTCCSSLA